MLDFKGIAKIFEEIELMLIRSLKRNIGRHKQEELQEKFQWTAWQAEKLRSLDKFRRENASIMNEYTDIIDSETRQLMEEQFKEGVNGVTAPQFETISDTPQVTLSLEPEFFGVDNTKVTKLMDDVVKLEKHVEVATLRTMDDVYRQTVHKAQLAMSTGMPLQKAIDMSVKDFLDKGINCIVYRDGRRVNIADYVRMALNTTSTRAALQGEAARIKALGYDTVRVSKYSMCSDTCLPWQGRPYIDDVFSLWDGEIEERENGELWGKSHYCGKWFPLLSTAIHAGLFHPNCRHSIALYVDGDPLPKALDNSEIEKRYKLEQKMRRLENNIRKAKRRVEGFSDPENIKKANKELREAQKKVREFIDQVNSEYGKIILKRDSDGREKIYDGEVDLKKMSGNEKIIDKSEKSDIIEEKEMLPRKSRTGNFAVDWEKVQSEEYSSKFRKLSDNEKISSAIETRAKWALNNRDAIQSEELYAVSLKSGSEIARITNQNYTAAVKRTKEFTEKLSKADMEGDNILLLHNHPRGLPPSISDINALFGNKNVSGITVGHNGSVYYYTKPKTIIPEDDWNIAMRHFKQFSEVTSMEKSLELLGKKYGFTITKL